MCRFWHFAPLQNSPGLLGERDSLGQVADRTKIHTFIKQQDLGCPELWSSRRHPRQRAMLSLRSECTYKHLSSSQRTFVNDGLSSLPAAHADGRFQALILSRARLDTTPIHLQTPTYRYVSTWACPTLSELKRTLY